MSLVDFAKQELELAFAGDDADKEYSDMMRKAVMELIELFANQGHSGMSASICTTLFASLARYQPLTPLTGEDSEWSDMGEMEPGLFQNKRYFSVFKKDGVAYDTNGKVFEDEKGLRYTSKDSHVNITFPYTPKCEVVKYEPASAL